MITIVADFTVRKQDKEKLLEAARELTIQSRKEPGNVSYALYEQIDDPYHMSFIERWQDQAAVDRTSLPSILTGFAPKSAIIWRRE